MMSMQTVYYQSDTRLCLQSIEKSQFICRLPGYEFTFNYLVICNQVFFFNLCSVYYSSAAYFFTDSVFSRWLRNFHMQHCIKLSLIIGYGIVRSSSVHFDQIFIDFFFVFYFYNYDLFLILPQV